MTKQHGELFDSIQGNILITRVKGGLNIESLAKHEEFYFSQMSKVAGKRWGILLTMDADSIGTPDTMTRTKYEFIWAFKGGCAAVAVVCASSFVQDIMNKLIGDAGYQFKSFATETEAMDWLKQYTDE